MIGVLTYTHIKHLFKLIPAEMLISELHLIRNVSSTIKAWQKLYLKYFMYVTAFAQVILTQISHFWELSFMPFQINFSGKIT